MLICNNDKLSLGIGFIHRSFKTRYVMSLMLWRRGLGARGFFAPVLKSVLWIYSDFKRFHLSLPALVVAQTGRYRWLFGFVVIVVVRHCADCLCRDLGDVRPRARSPPRPSPEIEFRHSETGWCRRFLAVGVGQCQAVCPVRSVRVAGRGKNPRLPSERATRSSGTTSLFRSCGVWVCVVS